MSAAERVAIEDAFKQYDKDDSGYINSSELFALCAELGAELSESELRKAVLKLDTDDSGAIELSEFTRWWLDSFGSGNGGAGGDDALDAKLANIAKTGKKAHYVDIHVAAWRGDVGVLERLLARDPSLAKALDETDFGEENTPLHYAAYNGHVEACQLLLRKGAALEATNEQGHIDVVRLLFDRGASVTAAENTRRLTPLDVARTPEIEEIFASKEGLRAPPKPDAPIFKGITKSGSVFIDWDDFTTLRPPVKFWSVVISRKSPDSDEFEDIENLTTPDAVSQIQLDRVPSGFTYAVRVSATNAIGTSELSDPCEPFTVKKLPSRPSALVAVQVTSSSVEVRWSNSHARGAKMKHYLLQWRHDTSPTYSAEDALRVDPDELENAAEKPEGKIYLQATVTVKRTGKTWLRVMGVNEVGRSKPSTELMVMVPKSNELGRARGAPRRRTASRPGSASSRRSASAAGGVTSAGAGAGEGAGAGVHGGNGSGNGRGGGRSDGQRRRAGRGSTSGASSKRRGARGRSRGGARGGRDDALSGGGGGGGGVGGGGTALDVVPVDVSGWDADEVATPSAMDADAMRSAHGEGGDDDDVGFRVHKLSATTRQRLMQGQ